MTTLAKVQLTRKPAGAARLSAIREVHRARGSDDDRLEQWFADTRSARAQRQADEREASVFYIPTLLRKQPTFVIPLLLRVCTTY